MINRKILYGYHICDGEIAVLEEESMVVKQIFLLYIEGESYQRIADFLNAHHIPFDLENQSWNKHKVKRMLENPRYMGVREYPRIITDENFYKVQEIIRRKNENRIKRTENESNIPWRMLTCSECSGHLKRTGGGNRPQGILYLRCTSCDISIKIPRAYLLRELIEQVQTQEEYSKMKKYDISAEAICLENAVNRSLEQIAAEGSIDLILEGISARYACCRGTINRLREMDWKHFRQTVSHVIITSENQVRVIFK